MQANVDLTTDHLLGLFASSLQLHSHTFGLV